MIRTLNRNDLLLAVEEEEYYIKNRRNIGPMDGIITSDEYETQPLLKWDSDSATIVTSREYFAQGEINWKKIPDLTFIHRKIMGVIDELGINGLISKNIDPSSYEYEPGFVLAGGFIHSTIIDQNGESMEFDNSHYVKCDIDCFAIGLDEVTAENNINRWYSRIEKHPPPGSKTIIRRTHNTNTVLVVFETYEIVVQFITKSYRGLSSLLHNFDISVSAIAMDRTQIYMTNLCSLSCRAGVVPVELAKRRSTYEMRITKYLNKWNSSSNLKFSYVFQDLANIQLIVMKDPYADHNTQISHLYVHLKYLTLQVEPHGTKNMGLYATACITVAGLNPNPYDVKRLSLCNDRVIWEKNTTKILNDEPPLVYSLAEPNEWTGEELRNRWWVDVGSSSDIKTNLEVIIRSVSDMQGNLHKARTRLGKFFNDAVELFKIEYEEERRLAEEKLLDKICNYVLKATDRFSYTKTCEKIQTNLEELAIGHNVSPDRAKSFETVKSLKIEDTFGYKERLGWYDDSIDAPFNFVIIPASVWYDMNYQQ